ncbi:MAG: efflux RND transporter periplasmic adaptor subunit [Thiotrichales bacterium]|nr:efflux RND transporter periplasmic adaptor subunit [Thiotrichales bacterium]
MKKLKKLKSYLGLLGSTGVFLTVLLWLMSDTESPAALTDPSNQRIQVSVVESIPTTLPIFIEANGITRSRWPTVINATVSGRVLTLMDNIRPGHLVPADSTLVTLQDTQYRAELEAARARVAEAELRLTEMKNRQYVKKAAGAATSSFGRYEPHVKAAKAQLLASKAALAAAQQQLDDTRIIAPFPAVIVTQKVSPGQWINAGEQLFTIASSELLEIKVELSEANWQRIGIPDINQAVQVFDPAGNGREARVHYLSPVMDPITRQRSVVLEVPLPYQGDAPLLPEQQVKVRFSGKQQQHVVRAPASVLTEDGKVWSVNEGKLNLESIELLDEQTDYILFRYVNQPEKTRQLVRYPLSSMLSGQEAVVLLTAERHTS